MALFEYFTFGHFFEYRVFHFWTLQEWEAFTGLIVADVKDSSKRDLPSWVEEERATPIGLLKVRLHSRLFFFMLLVNKSHFFTVGFI